jgi:putative oxidoreductase
MKRLILWVIGLLEAVPYSLLALLGRFAVGLVFFNSGRTKVEGWNIFALKDSAVFLFENEYKVPYIDPVVAAHLAAFAEHVFPVLLWIGLASRFAALGLLAMTAVIQIFVYPSAYVEHGLWATALAMIAILGPGKISLDHIIRTRS